ncbi:hypothetical protein DMI69_02210 [Escherichia coli]|nr:hypothetical protein [Escherichia coli]
MDYLLLLTRCITRGWCRHLIAAGINLNFGRLGRFSAVWGVLYSPLRLKAINLYSTVFREYLGELFSRGYSVEYFVEGGHPVMGVC